MDDTPRRRIVSFAQEFFRADAAHVLNELMQRHNKLGPKLIDGADSPNHAATLAFDPSINLHFPEARACTCDLTDTEAEMVRNDPRVASVEDDETVFPLSAHMHLLAPCAQGKNSQGVQWNISMVGADKAWRRTTGKGVKVAVLDTGVDPDHPDLTIQEGRSFVVGDEDFTDHNGHGTHCAGVIGARDNELGVVGVAPQCDLYAGKVLGESGGKVSWIVSALTWCAREGMDVVSMSLGSNVSDPDVRCHMAYQRVAQKVMEQGGIIVAAAGNSGRTDDPWVNNPARCSGFMAVGAVDRRKRLASFSSHGTGERPDKRSVEIVAPGVQVRSTYLRDGYKELSGTSMACPHVSGAAALLKEQHPTWGPDKIRRRLTEMAEDIGAPADDPETGAGLLDVERAVFGAKADVRRMQRNGSTV